jgi:virulence factor Mce-like protein
MRLSVGLRHKALGIGFLAVIAFGLWFLVALFNKTFEDSVPLRVQISRAGTQLNADADVKIRGLIIGRVDSQETHGSSATLHLAITPRNYKLIPGNVQARILPKTLFGEKFVDLVVPEGETAPPIARNAIISEDRSQSALEVERVLADLFPLLRAVQPAKLNNTLNAIATALEGRGLALGENLVRVDDYLGKLEPHLATINEDISGLADLASSLNDNADELLAVARNTAFTSRTLVEKQTTLKRFLAANASLSDSLGDFLTDEELQLLENARLTRKTLEEVVPRRGVLPGAVKGLRNLVAKLNDALGVGPYLNIRLETVPNRGSYSPADCPRYPGDPADPAATGSNCPDAPANGSGAAAYSPRVGGTVGAIGSAEEKEAVRQLVGALLGQPAPDAADIVDLLAGPILRGPFGTVRP